MYLRVAIFLVSICLPAVPAVVGISDPTALGSNDSVGWAQLGPANSVLSGTINAVSTHGTAVTGTSALFQRVDEGNGWLGDFTLGDALFWNTDSGAPMTFVFAHPVRGGGTFIEGDLIGGFSATITAYNGASLLETYTVSGTNNAYEDGSAPFAGLLSDSANITKLVFSEASNSGPANEFAIDSLVLNSSMPEPKTLGLGATAILVMLGAVSYKRTRKRPFN